MEGESHGLFQYLVYELPIAPGIEKYVSYSVIYWKRTRYAREEVITLCFA